MTSENAAVAAATDKTTAGVLRNYFCPKCGAVGSVRWVRAVSQQEWDDATAKDRAARDNYDAAYQEHLKKHGERGARTWYRRYWSPLPDGWWDSAREGLEHGEHLVCSCPRCGFGWRDSILTATAGTPIYDALAAS